MKEVSDGVSIDGAVVAAFHRTANLQRQDVFEDDRLTPITAVDDAHVAAPGWVGSNWAFGTLLIGINPGGGGDGYRRNPTDDQLYAALRKFRAASGASDQRRAFSEVSDIWMNLQRTHNIWRIIDPILDAVGESIDEIAFMNVLPFRTRGDAAAPSRVLRTAWAKVAKPQIEALRPKRIIALGRKAWDVLAREQLPTSAQAILFKRGIGDSYIPEESKEVLRQLRVARGA